MRFVCNLLFTIAARNCKEQSTDYAYTKMGWTLDYIKINTKFVVLKNLIY